MRGTTTKKEKGVAYVHAVMVFVFFYFVILILCICGSTLAFIFVRLYSNNFLIFVRQQTHVDKLCGFFILFLSSSSLA